MCEDACPLGSSRPVLEGRHISKLVPAHLHGRNWRPGVFQRQTKLALTQPAALFIVDSFIQERTCWCCRREARRRKKEACTDDGISITWVTVGQDNGVLVEENLSFTVNLLVGWGTVHSQNSRSICRRHRVFGHISPIMLPRYSQIRNPLVWVCVLSAAS